MVFVAFAFKVDLTFLELQSADTTEWAWLVLTLTAHSTHLLTLHGPARSIGLNSPWDLQLLGRTLYIAMAGPHQIWKFDLDNNELVAFAGSGREGRRDGSLLEASFAQPSGITTDGKTLYTADSEANVIRAIDLSKGKVNTLAGADLFGFGDTDGFGSEVRLQHPLGILSLGDKILVADTYNHKIKELDPQSRLVRTFRGTGKSGQKDGRYPTFHEPAGLSVANDKLYIADTNNHAIRVVDLKTKATSTLSIKGLEPPIPPTLSSSADIDGPNAEEFKLATQRLRAGAVGSLLVDIKMPDGYHLNPAASQRYNVSVENGGTALTLDGKTASRSAKELRLPVEIPLRAVAKGSAELRIQFTLFYCREDNTGTCRVKTLVFRAPVEVTDELEAPSEVKVKARLDAK
jgi:DNA-binding beta-propeller fold protein YncE